MPINNTENNSGMMPHDLNTYIKVAGIACIGILTLFLLTKTINEVKSYTTIGENPSENGRTITVQGHGEISAQPDVAMFSWTVTEEGKTVEEAQSNAATKNNKAVEYLKQQGVKTEDISVQNYNTYEKYDNRPCVVQSRGVDGSISSPCTSSNQISGYTTNQTVDVKVKGVQQNDKKLGEYIAAIGGFGVKTSQVSFSFDKPENLKNMAREAAIYNARQQAITLSKSLGVKIGKVVGFQDGNSNNYGYAGMEMKAQAMDSRASAPVAPELPNGDKKMTDDVSVTYSIE